MKRRQHLKVVGKLSMKTLLPDILTLTTNTLTLNERFNTEACST